MKAWLKGGLMLFFIYAILFSIFGFNNGRYGDDVSMPTDRLIVLFPSAWINYIFELTSINYTYFLVIGILFDFVIYFLIGAIIGLIIQKVKSRGEK